MNAFYKFLCLVFISLIGSAPYVLAESHNNHDQANPLKVGFVLCGTGTDCGWNQSHNDGRLYLEKNMNGKVKTIVAENIPENAEAGRIMEKMVSQGCKVIFSTSYGYLDPMLKVAAHYPDVIFMQINRYAEKKLDNLGVFYPYYFEPLYAAGIVAGRMTKSNKLGFIVGHAVPNVLTGVNAFALGAQSVNSKIRVKLVCTNSWNDPVIEVESTKALIEGGNDVIASILNSSLNVCTTVEKSSAFCVGTSYDLNKQAPKTWLTGQAWNYGPMYVRIVEQIVNHSWKPGTQYFLGKDSYAALASFGTVVPNTVRREAEQTFKKIKEGKLSVFMGPIEDNARKIRVQAGQKADIHCLEQMNWVVAGVEKSK
jgi:basic membrane protein A